MTTFSASQMSAGYGIAGGISSLAGGVSSFLGARNAKKAGKMQAKAILKETKRQQFFRELEATKNKAELATAFAKSGITGNVVAAVEAEFATWERAAIDQIGYEGRVAAWEAKQRAKGQAAQLTTAGVSAISQGVQFAGQSYSNYKQLKALE